MEDPARTVLKVKNDELYAYFIVDIGLYLRMKDIGFLTLTKRSTFSPSSTHIQFSTRLWCRII